MSPKSSEYTAAVLGGVALAGLGVTIAGAYAEPTDKKPEADHSVAKTKLTSDVEVPAFPKSTEELLALYSSSKVPIAKIFRIVGQMAVAPIAWQALMCLRARYEKSLNTGSSF